jgi:hypothetical protein
MSGEPDVTRGPYTPDLDADDYVGTHMDNPNTQDLINFFVYVSQSKLVFQCLECVCFPKKRAEVVIN